MKSLFPERYHFYIYVFALIILVIGLPLSKFMMSVAQIILAANWLLAGNLKTKITIFLKNKPAVILSSFFLLHLLGLLYTADFDYASNDIRIKMPLFALPIIFSTSIPLEQKTVKTILHFFIGSVIFCSINSTLILSGIIHRNIVDVRDISIFISHIRFSLLICIAIFICSYFIYGSISFRVKIIYSVIIIWFLIFLVLMESLTGISVLVVVGIILGIYYIYKTKNKTLKYVSVLLLLSCLILFYFILQKAINRRDIVDTIDLNKVDTLTANENKYAFDTLSTDAENGHLVWMYYCDRELEQVWNSRSKINYTDKDLKGNDLRYTLVRFLASKGLRKDKEALNSLTDEEIKDVERGVTNMNYKSISSFMGRIYETLWEINLYKKSGDANGHSLTQRFEYWKTAVTIIKSNFCLGVGTGDVQKSFDEEYIKSKSKLNTQWRLHTHNQYLTIAVAFGMIGFCWFLFTLIYPVLKQKMFFDFLYITFFIVALISFINEDTLETQAGVTFFTFFNCFFLFARKK